MRKYAIIFLVLVLNLFVNTKLRTQEAGFQWTEADSQLLMQLLQEESEPKRKAIWEKNKQRINTQWMNTAIQMAAQLGESGNADAGILIDLRLAEASLWMADKGQAAWALLNAGLIYMYNKSDNNSARTLFEKSLALYKEVGSKLGEANCISSLGDIALRTSDNKTAEKLYKEAIRLFKDIQDSYSLIASQKNLSLTLLADSRLEPAKKEFNSAIQSFLKTRPTLPMIFKSV